jgi:hypothetical protein
MKPWVGVDLDGTLAHYEGWKGGSIGEPVERIVALVRALPRNDLDVRIFTARADTPQQVIAVQDWCREHLGSKLAVTNVKDYGCLYVIDDRAVSVEANTGQWHSLNYDFNLLMHDLGVTA